MKTVRRSALSAAGFAFAASAGLGALADDSGRGADWQRNEAAIRTAELCEGWSGDQRKRQDVGRERWERDNLSTGDRLHAVERGRRQAERLVRDKGCESAEVKDLLDFFHRYIEKLFD